MQVIALLIVAASGLWLVCVALLMIVRPRQKPMLGDRSGLTDTMWDLQVNAVGAAVISLAGWRYLRRARTSFVVRWSKRFIDRNAQLFGD